MGLLARIVMKLFLITLIFLLSFFLLCGIGFIFAKKALKGSCGGLGKIMGEDCMFCEKKDQCDKKKNSDNSLEPII